MSTRRADAHLKRAEVAAAKSEAAATEADAKRAVERQLLHLLAAADELQLAVGTTTRAEIRAERRATKRKR